MEYQTKKPTYPAYVDDVFAFSPCDFTRSLLRPAKNGSNKQGLAVLRRGLSEFKVAWKMDLNQKKPYLRVRFLKNKGIYEQIIKLTSMQTLFGEKPYFRCRCGKLCGKLYLRDYYWLCRECNNLRYFLSFGLNRKCKCGELFYQTNRWCKIMELQEKMKRCVYRNDGTRRAQSLINAMHKWVLGEKAQARLKAESALRH